MPKKKQLPDFSIDISIDEYNISPKKKDFCNSISDFL
jgi:hypothetical protein